MTDPGTMDSAGRRNCPGSRLNPSPLSLEVDQSDVPRSLPVPLPGYRVSGRCLVFDESRDRQVRSSRPGHSTHTATRRRRRSRPTPSKSYDESGTFETRYMSNTPPGRTSVDRSRHPRLVRHSCGGRCLRHLRSGSSTQTHGVKDSVGMKTQCRTTYWNPIRFPERHGYFDSKYFSSVIRNLRVEILRHFVTQVP